MAANAATFQQEYDHVESRLHCPSCKSYGPLPMSIEDAEGTYDMEYNPPQFVRCDACGFLLRDGDWASGLWKQGI